MITWLTDKNLGSVTVNLAANIQLIAVSSTDEEIFYTLTNETALPNGLILTLSGLVIGRPLQDTLLTFDGENTTFDQKQTTFDQKFTFTVMAQGITSLESSEKEFEIYVNAIAYKNIIVKAFLNNKQRNLWNNFINNETVFTPQFIHRFENNQYGVNRELNMLVFAGIQNEIAEKYISLTGINHKKKRFQFGDIEIASAIMPGQRTIEYEAIYVKIYDPLENNNQALATRIKNYSNQQDYLTAAHNNVIFYTRDTKLLATPIPTFSRIKPNIQIDTTGYFASDPNPAVYFPSSIKIWRQQVLNWRENSELDQENDGFYTERNYLPLWMRTIQFQNNQTQELGYVPAVVLCYCVPGTATKIKKNIENYMNSTGFNFNQLDFTVDRFIIDNYFFFRQTANMI